MEKKEYFIADLSMSGEAAKKTMNILLPEIEKQGTKFVGTFVIGSARADVHDIGKNLVAAYLRGAGFRVIDLGVDVTPEKFVEAAKKYKANIAGASAYNTSVADIEFPLINKAFAEAGLRDEVKLMLGGAGDQHSLFFHVLIFVSYVFIRINSPDVLSARAKLIAQPRDLIRKGKKTDKSAIATYTVSGGKLQDNNKPFLISCGALRKEIEQLIEQGSLSVEPCFLESYLHLHLDYDFLERALTQTIEKCLEHKSKGIAVVYGDLCHPKMKQIIAKYPNVVKVDALNCIDCLLGGHGKLLEIDPNHECFYLSVGWMPSNLKKNAQFDQLLDPNNKRGSRAIKIMFRGLKGIILFDSLGNLEEFKKEIEEFKDRTGLSEVDTKAVGLTGLKNVILEAIRKLKSA